MRPTIGTLLKQLNHSIQIGVSSAKYPRSPVSTSLNNPLSIGSDFELTDLAVGDSRGDAEPILRVASLAALA